MGRSFNWVSCWHLLRYNHQMKNLLSSYFKHYAGFSQETWILLTTIFINTLGGVITVFLSLYLINDLHFNVMQVGAIITCIGIGGIIGSYISGILCDKRSELNICIISLLINATALFLLIFPTQLIFLILIAFTLGLSNASFAPANRVLLMKYVAPKDQYRINSFRYMIINLGFGIGVLACGFLATISYHLVFFFNAFATFLAASVLFFHSFSSRAKNKQGKLKHSKVDEISQNQVFKANIYWLYLALLFATLIFSQLRATYPIYLDMSYHLSPSLFSYLFLINTACIVIFQVPLLAFLKKKLNILMITGSGVFFIGFGMFLLPFGDSYYYAICSCLVWTLGELLFFSTIQVLIFEKASQHAKGKAMGVYQMITAFGNMSGPALGSWLYHFMNSTVLWYCCGLLGGISFLIFLFTYLTQSTERILN